MFNNQYSQRQVTAFGGTFTLTYPVARPVEHLHEKVCLGQAMISAIENFRDDEHMTDHEFTLYAQDGMVLQTARKYLHDDLQNCICVGPWNVGELALAWERGGDRAAIKNIARYDLDETKLAELIELIGDEYHAVEEG